jgi:hypothetical protein
VRPRGPVRVFPTTLLDGAGEIRGWGGEKLFIHDGKYFFTLTFSTVTLWDPLTGKIIMSFDSGGSGFIEAVTLTDEDGLENVVIANYTAAAGTGHGYVATYITQNLLGQPTFFNSALQGSRLFSVVKTTVPKPGEVWDSPPSETFSFAVPIVVSGIFMDDRYISAAGPTATDIVEKRNASFLLLAQHSQNVLIVDTGASIPQFAVIEVAWTTSHLVLHTEFETASHVFIYELGSLISILEKCTTNSTIIQLPPVRIRIAPFHPDSHCRPPSYWDCYVLPNGFLGAGREASDCMLCVTWLHREEHQEEDDEHQSAWRLYYHVLDHLFDDSGGGERRRHNVTIPRSLVRRSEFTANWMLWALPGGCVAYVPESQLELRLGLFTFDGEWNDFAVMIPSFIDLLHLCEVDMNRKWGVLGLYMSDATVYIINFA